jgi:hypothetical protein
MDEFETIANNAIAEAELINIPYDQYKTFFDGMRKIRDLIQQRLEEAEAEIISRGQLL